MSVGGMRPWAGLAPQVIDQVAQRDFKNVSQMKSASLPLYRPNPHLPTHPLDSHPHLP